ncbi:MAG: DUF2785 domain-containing protein [Pseudomonadales bacterium]|nr:DUF2785 domain-containing protein [Pseudomonadales bacterium]
MHLKAMNITSTTLPGLILVMLGSLFSPAAFAQPDPECTSDQANIAWWQEIHEQRDETRMVTQALARDLLPCLGSANPVLRDSIGYKLYSYWLRNERLDRDSKRFLRSALQSDLQSTETLRRSFSALILAELMRADAIDSFMTATERDALLQSTSDALQAETDYRGLDAELGWVHPVAHLADVLWRFALHPALNAEQARQIQRAVSSKATPVQASYAFNEGDRLARVISQLMAREVLAEDQWQNWLAQYETRRDGQDWGTAFASPEGMAELHNAKLFVRALADQITGSSVSSTLQEAVAELVAMFTALV